MNKNTKGARPVRIPIEKVILFLAASFAAYNYGLAGGYIEGTRFSIGGLIAGILVNITIAVAASRFGTLKGTKRTKQAAWAFIAMLFLSPVLVSPVIFYSLPETFLGVWWLRALWSVGWLLVADLAIVLAGAVSGKGLVALSDHASVGASQSATGSTESNAGASHSAKGANAVRKVQLHSAKSATDSEPVHRAFPRKCDHCEQIIRTPQSVGAHMKKHHPELCKPKVLAENLFENVKVQP
jgi:hypothetical protein